MKHNTTYVLYVLLAAFAFVLPFARGNREINPDTLRKLFALYATNMEKKDATWVHKQYHLDSAAHEQALVYGAASAVKVNEIAVFKQTDKTKWEALQKFCQEHTDRQLESFQGYAPRQGALLEKAVVYEDGRYAIVLIHPQQLRLQQLLKKAW